MTAYEITVSEEDLQYLFPKKDKESGKILTFFSKKWL